LVAWQAFELEQVLLLDELVILKEQGLNNKITAEMMGEERYSDSRGILGMYRRAYMKHPPSRRNSSKIRDVAH
jgi:hypothetical protein